MATSVDQGNASQVPKASGRDEEVPSQWSLNLLGALLALALAGSLALSFSLWLRIDRMRSALDAADAQPRSSVPAAKPPVEAPPPQGAPHLAESALPAVAPQEPAPSPATSLQAGAAPAPEERLILLLTVGTRQFAEKQLRALQEKCRAPLAVYQQRRGRCAFSTCFAVAAKEADADLVHGCGETKGQALRDRADFAALH